MLSRTRIAVKTGSARKLIVGIGGSTKAGIIKTLIYLKGPQRDELELNFKTLKYLEGPERDELELNFQTLII